ncbi:MAG: tRNA (adenosine(37)-N6)-threonylcarbamoyltransferase complex dimerization subunit type 1 TsaB [Kordiimonadaceae bacterium]|nr:tRNA (adenosine(37)-N6)-threonylcarbamoyltransferase complex dimerization subunit type 1 TsaB [Kordiimonadaceae bacterium]
MTILAIDTSETCCSAALLFGDGTSVAKSEDIGRGHAERLLPMVEELLAGAGIGYDSLARLAVVTGPGTFTGLRIGLSVARGLALALKIPCIGLMSLPVIAAEVLASAGDGGKAHVVTNGRGGQVFYQLYESSKSAEGKGENNMPLAVGAPRNIDADVAAKLVMATPGLIGGSGVSALRDFLPEVPEIADMPEHNIRAVDPIRLASLSAALKSAAYPPEPTYLRPADAIKAKAIFPVIES